MKENKDNERIGEQKIYSGEYELVRCPNPFKYVIKNDDKIANEPIKDMPDWIFGHVPKMIKLNCKGTYVGKGLFATLEGDIFKEI